VKVYSKVTKEEVPNKPDDPIAKRLKLLVYFIQWMILPFAKLEDQS
jgi:hypothetical protein